MSGDFVGWVVAGLVTVAIRDGITLLWRLKVREWALTTKAGRAAIRASIHREIEGWQRVSEQIAQDEADEVEEAGQENVKLYGNF